MSDVRQNSQSPFPGLVPAEGKYVKARLLLLPLAVVTIYLMIIPIVILDACVTVYQWIYFTAMRIPKLKKSQFVVMERWDLSKLTFWQKINCVYCEYANGILAFAKAVGNQTEIYSCAIKHYHALKGHEYERPYHSAEKFK
jgi:hypothetical protein